jgi:hypothetical protein
MMARKKFEVVEVARHFSLEQRIERVQTDEAIGAILDNDRRLVEASLATDKRVASLDDRVRAHL